MINKVITVTEVRSASFGLAVLHTHHTFANSLHFHVNWELSVTIFHSMCIFWVYHMAVYWPILQFYLYVYVSVCQYVLTPGECYYNTVLYNAACVHAVLLNGEKSTGITK